MAVRSNLLRQLIAAPLWVQQLGVVGSQVVRGADTQAVSAILTCVSCLHRIFMHRSFNVYMQYQLLLCVCVCCLLKYVCNVLHCTVRVLGIDVSGSMLRSLSCLLYTAVYAQSGIAYQGSSPTYWICRIVQLLIGPIRAQLLSSACWWHSMLHTCRSRYACWHAVAVHVSCRFCVTRVGLHQ